MERPEIKGVNAVACITDPVLAADILGTAGIEVATIAAACDVPAVIAILGVG